MYTLRLRNAAHREITQYRNLRMKPHETRLAHSKLRWSLSRADPIVHEAVLFFFNGKSGADIIEGVLKG